MQMPTPSSRQESDALSIVIQERRNQRDLCDDLEQIADQLGGPVDSRLCAFVLKRLRHDMPLYHRDEEVLFEVLQTHEEDGVIARCVELVFLEHAVQESYLLDLAEPLGDIVGGKKIYNMDTVGYMLRCCFEGIRTHLNWEDATLLGGELHVIADAYAEKLAAGIARNRSVLARHLNIAH
jgi:hypothetical protein